MLSLTRSASINAARSLAPSSSSSLARGFATCTIQNKDVKNVTVFGAGLMGAGIAQVLAHKGGFNVTLADVTDKATENGRSIISKSLTRIAKKYLSDKSAEEQSQFVKSIVDSIQTTTDASKAVESTDLVIEAIIENVGIKQELFKFLDSKAPKDAIFASNTSSLSITDCAKTTQRLDRFGGFHAFNPVPQMKLVEIVRTKETSDETFNSLMDVAKKMGKTPVACVDAPGFIVNRLLVPYLMEAIRLVERGDATAEDVDTAMKLGAGYPMGPLELCDMVGLDTLSHIVKGWRESRVSTGEISGEIVKEVANLEKLVKAGKFGRKNGEGFYKY